MSDTSYTHPRYTHSAIALHWLMAILLILSLIHI